jgi:hypothetical protein
MNSEKYRAGRSSSMDFGGGTGFQLITSEFRWLPKDLTN